MIFLADSTGIGGLFTALGLNWQAFLFDLAAFLISAYIIGRWVFPPLTKALDAKTDELEAATKHEADAKSALEEAEKKATHIISEARASADDIISTAHAEAADQLETAKQRAKDQSDRLVAEAREQLSRDIAEARRELKGETAKLVVQATEALLDEKLDQKHDEALIARSVGAK